jgi:hypothetical protein
LRPRLVCWRPTGPSNPNLPKVLVSIFNPRATATRHRSGGSWSTGPSSSAWWVNPITRAVGALTVH